MNTPSAPRSAADPAFRQRLDRLLPAALILILITLNLLTAERLPIVWTDEVMFSEPAINYLTGRGFTSSSWPIQRAHETFAGNSPLHTLLLIPWLSIFGVSPTAVRSINFVLLGIVALVGLRVVRTVGGGSEHAAQAGVPSSRMRTWIEVAWVLLLFGAYGLSFSYRSGRYDLLGILWVVLVAAAATIRDRRWRFALVFLAALPIAPTGLHILPLLVALAALVLLWRRREGLVEIVAAGAGSALGLAVWFAALHHAGLLDRLRAYISRWSNLGSGLSQRLAGIREGLIGDPSSLYLQAALAFLAAFLWNRDRDSARILAWAVAASLFIAVCIGATGRMPIYYSWMKYLPLAVGLGAAAWRLAASSTPRLALLALAAAAPAALLMPLRLANAARNWPERSHDTVVQLVAPHVGPADTTLVSMGAYYPAKSRAVMLYTTEYGDLSPSERDALTVLILSTIDTETGLARAGGAERWQLVAEMPGIDSGRVPFGYDLRVFRRRDATPN